ncbi:unnamed protein product [Amoebophrya sp. A25]|nr:unnamed protein product [Amoebophrya sp. A25]|eukprot:GSA25T00021979001.1
MVFGVGLLRPFGGFAASFGVGLLWCLAGSVVRWRAWCWSGFVAVSPGWVFDRLRRRFFVVCGWVCRGVWGGFSVVFEWFCSCLWRGATEVAGRVLCCSVCGWVCCCVWVGRCRPLIKGFAAVSDSVSYSVSGWVCRCFILAVLLLRFGGFVVVFGWVCCRLGGLWCLLGFFAVSSS